MRLPHFILGAIILLGLAAMRFDQQPVHVESPDKVTITYWEKWAGFEGEAIKSTIKLFNSKKIKNKNGQVIECRCLTTSQIDRKSLLSIAGGHPPDLAGFWSYNTHLMADMNALMPLDNFVKRDNFDLDKYLDVFRHDCTYRRQGDKDERLWCLPTTPASVALHWNKEMFARAGLDPERPPRTIEELEQFSEKLTTKNEKTGEVEQMGFLPPEPGWWNYGWGFFFGGPLNEGLEKVTANDPRNIEALTWVAKFAKKNGGGEKLLGFKQGFGSHDSPQNAFLSGKVGMVLQGVWEANFIRFHNPHLKYGCAAFPSKNLEGGPVTIAEMDVITIPRGSPHPDEAWEVIKFINSQEGMEYLCKLQGKLTPFKKNTPGWIEQHPHPQLQVFIDLASSKNAVTTPKLAVWDEYQKELIAAFERVFIGSQTAKEALDQVQVRMQEKLDRAIAIRRLRDKEGRE